MRRVSFEIGEYYHIFNRGVESRIIFCDRYDYIRFIRGMREFNQIESIGSLYERGYQNRKISQIKRSNLQLEIGSHDGCSKKLVDMICYCLNPNHFHFLLKQNQENGISKFMHKLGLGYTMYFNQKYNRSGSLFQGKYKYVHTRSNENLLRLSAYINANIEIHKIRRAKDWEWGSYLDYIGLRAGTMCKKEDILNQFENIRDYRDFTDFIIKEEQDLKSNIKNYLE